jgi:hypothetical protein
VDRKKSRFALRQVKKINLQSGKNNPARGKETPHFGIIPAVIFLFKD